MQITKISQTNTNISTNKAKQVHFGEMNGEPYITWKENKYNNIIKERRNAYSYYETQYKYWGMSKRRYIKGIEAADTCFECKVRDLNNFDDYGRRIVKTVEKATENITGKQKNLGTLFSKLFKLIR